jgi:hypothetical protein
MDKTKVPTAKGSPASWTLASTTEGRLAIRRLGRLGIILRISFTTSSHRGLTPARSGISGSRLFTSAGGFPERGGLRHQPTTAPKRASMLIMRGAPLKKSGTQTSTPTCSARWSAIILGFGKGRPNISVRRTIAFVRCVASFGAAVK